MKTTLPLLALAGLLIASPALANEDDMQAKAQHYLEKIDTNKDSKISKEEHDAFGDQMFTEADTNKDNAISLAELTAQKEKEKTEYKNETGKQ